MEDDFLANYMITYIENDIARTFTIDSIINEFDTMKEFDSIIESIIVMT